MDWKIEKSTFTCFSCRKAMAEAEPYFSALFPYGAAFQRRDFCLACWPVPEEPFSFWKTAVPRKEEKKKVDRRAIMDFFERLYAAEDPIPARARLLYLFALILLRKKVLKLVDVSTEGGGEVLACERVGTGERFIVPNPGIADSEIEGLREEMSRVFEMAL
jgi:hypothetical protein